MRIQLLLIVLIILLSCNCDNSYKAQSEPMIDSLLLGWGIIYGERLFPHIKDSSTMAYSDSTKLFSCLKKNDTLIIYSRNEKFWTTIGCNYSGIDKLILDFKQWDLELDTCFNIPSYASFTSGKDTMFYIFDHVRRPNIWVLTNAHLCSSDKKIFNLRIGENICDVLESLSAKSYFSDEIKHLIITRYNDYDKRRGYKKPRYWDPSIPREAYVIYIKVDNLIITEIRLYNFMNEDGKLFYSQYII